jgi:hypothetical protein
VISFVLIFALVSALWLAFAAVLGVINLIVDHLLPSRAYDALDRHFAGDE